MDLLHARVEHSRFGSGTITDFDGRRLSVAFDAGGERRFVWPDAFDSFLTADDERIQAEARDALARRREEAQAALKSAEDKIAALASECRRAPRKSAGRSTRPKPV